MGILNFQTGELQTPTAIGVLTRASIPIAPSVLTLLDTVSGKKDETFKVMTEGLEIIFLVDVGTPDTVKNLLDTNKAYITGSFVGTTEH